MRFACFSSALLTIVHKQQAAALHLDSEPAGQADAAMDHTPLWLEQEGAQEDVNWTELVQRGLEAAEQENAA